MSEATMKCDSLYQMIVEGLRATSEPGDVVAEARSWDEIIAKLSKKISTAHGDVVSQRVADYLKLMSKKATREEIARDIEGQATMTAVFDRYTELREMEDGFDRMHQTETSEIYEHFFLPDDVSGKRIVECARYHPSPIKSVALILDTLQDMGILFEDYCFIDVGSGLGRNLLIARNYAFKEIIGIEISDFLHQKALSNIRKFQEKFPDAARIKSYCINALHYSFPQENLILYFWEPFGSELADEFCVRLNQHVISSGKKVFAVFLGAALDAIKKSPQFTLIDMFETSDKTVSEEDFFVVSVFESN